MKKILALALMFVLLLSACNTPLSGQQPTPDEIATVVAQTLNAWDLTETPPAETPNTPAPSSTSQPSATVQPSDTPTSAPTATPAPGDPASALGQPTWKTTLDENKVFFTGGETEYSDGYTQIKWEPGKLTLTSLTNTGWKGWRLAYFKPKNFYLQAVLNTRSCAENDQYGLVFRAPDYESGSGYHFGLTCTGKYGLRSWKDGSAATLVDWSENSAILTGPNQSNRLGVQITDDAIKLYANGVLLKEISDTSFSVGGHFGIFIAGVSSTGFTFELDEIAFWEQ